MGRNNGIIDILVPVAYACGVRPSWRQSELDVFDEWKDLGFSNKPNETSFKGTFEANYAEAGSVRPDLFNNTDNISLEVKNYDLSSQNKLNNLINNINNQYPKRAANLPKGAEQWYLIDLRGQNVFTDNLDELAEQISKNTPVLKENIFFKK